MNVMVFKLLKFKLYSFNMNIFFCKSELYKNWVNDLCIVLFNIILIDLCKSSHCAFSKNFFLLIVDLLFTVNNFRVA